MPRAAERRQPILTAESFPARRFPPGSRHDHPNAGKIPAQAHPVRKRKLKPFFLEYSGGFPLLAHDRASPPAGGVPEGYTFCGPVGIFFRWGCLTAFEKEGNHMTYYPQCQKSIETLGGRLFFKAAGAAEGGGVAGGANRRRTVGDGITLPPNPFPCSHVDGMARGAQHSGAHVNHLGPQPRCTRSSQLTQCPLAQMRASRSGDLSTGYPQRPLLEAQSSQGRLFPGC